MTTESTTKAADDRWFRMKVEPGAAFTRMADATRGFMEAQLRAEIDSDVADRVASVLKELHDQLAPHIPEGTPGQRFTEGGPLRNDWGNAVVGLRNPVALPLDIERHSDGRARSTYEVGCLYEGAPNQLHGGFCAMVLDQLLCEAAAACGRAGVTVSLNLSYHRVAPMGTIGVEAYIDHIENRKTFVRGQITNDRGEVCVSAEALVLVPRTS